MPTAGQIIRAADFTDAVVDRQDAAATTTSATFTATLTGGAAASVAFMAPTSGKVLIHNAARMANSGANESYCSFHIRTGAVIGSGSDVLTAADARSVVHVGTTVERAGESYLVTGLTPGASYNVVQEFRASAGTATYASRELSVTPTT